LIPGFRRVILRLLQSNTISLRERSAMGPKHPYNGLKPAAFEARILASIGLGIITLGFVFCLPPISQDQSYHAFADDRTMLGIPNFLNVASNLPFLVVGVIGLRLLLQYDAGRPDGPVLERAERWPLLVLFAGILLTAFGSSYYHLAPDNDRLVWDRLSMTVAFMGWFASTTAERIGTRGEVATVAPGVAGFCQRIRMAHGGATRCGRFAPVRLRAVLSPGDDPSPDVPVPATVHALGRRASWRWAGIFLPRCWRPAFWTTAFTGWGTW
jgi:hypothetical protein